MVLKISLKTKMTVAVSLLVGALLIVTSGFSFLYFASQLKQTISHQQFTLVTAIADEIDGKIDTAREHLEGMAAMVSSQVWSSPEAAQKFLDQQVDNQALFDSGLFLATPHGEIVAEIAREPAACRKDCPLEAWLRRTASVGRSQISDPFAWGRKDPRPVVLFTVPIFDRPGGEVRAVLGGGLDLLRGNFLGKLAEVRLGDGGYLYLYDRQRTLIVHPDRSRILQRDVPLGVNRLFDAALTGFEGTGETTTSRGLQTLSSFRRLQARDWILAANFPLTEAYAPLRKAKVYFALGSAALVFLASLVVWFLMRHLTAPLIALTDHVRRFGDGEEVPNQVRLRVRDEIGTLGQIFNRLLEKMADQRECLDEQRRFSENLLQNAGAAAFVLDAKHRVIAWNRACEELTGMGAEKLLGTEGHWRAYYDHQRPCLADFVIRGNVEELPGQYADFRHSQLVPQGLSAEAWLTLHGRRRYIIFNAAPVFNRRGEIIAAIETLEDITERKAAEESLAQSLSLLQATLNSTADGILVIDLGGKIVSYNRRFTEIWPLAEEVLDSGDGWKALASFLRQLKEPSVFSERIRALHVHPEEESGDSILFRDGRIFELFSRPQRLAEKTVGRVWSFRDVTRQRQTLDQLGKVSLAVEQSPNVVMITDADGFIEYVNRRFTEVSGFSAEEAIGQTPISLLDGDSTEEYYQTLRETITAGRQWRGEFQNRKKNGEFYWVSTLISPVKSPEGVISHFVVIEEDITEKRCAERRQQLTARVLSLLSLPSEKTDKVRDILQLIKDFTGCEAVGILLRENGGYRALGLEEEFHAVEELLKTDGGEIDDCLCGQVLLDRTDPTNPRFTLGGCFWTGSNGAEALAEEMPPCPCSRCRYEGYSSLALIPLRSGEEIIGLLQLGDRREGMITSGHVAFLEGLAASIGIAFEHRQSEEKLLKKEERLHYLTNYDPLTGLPNRVLLRDRLQHALAKARRSGRKVALYLVDLDRFKTVNDSLGHSAGDLILRQVAVRLERFVREADTLARFGGDEFAILLEEIGEDKEVTALAQKVLQQLAEPIEVEGIPIHLTGSVGISLFPDDSGEMESLTKFSEMAMYRAKESGRNAFRFYRPEMNARNRELLLLENSLHQALGQEQLVLFYQPQVELGAGKVRGVEALLRWRHPELGLIPPGDFIPLAEETGLILPMGEWVLRTACAQGREWVAEGWADLRIAVNISSRQFQQPGFVDLVDRVLQETGLHPNRLELEITESVLMTDVETNLRTLGELRDRGIHLAIDDFGTGYSSLSYLRRFAVQRLKIDKSFIQEVQVNVNDQAIARSVIALARAMGLEVVAEGIETEEQLLFLRENGCQEGQGYLFSRPLPAAQMAEYLSRRPRNGGGSALRGTSASMEEGGGSLSWQGQGGGY